MIVVLSENIDMANLVNFNIAFHVARNNGEAAVRMAHFLDGGLLLMKALGMGSRDIGTAAPTPRFN